MYRQLTNGSSVAHSYESGVRAGKRDTRSGQARMLASYGSLPV